MCVTVLQKIPTGCEAVDKILEGGFPIGDISLIYGEAETGKTTLAMQCAVNCARQGYKTLFVDCDSTFSARRLSQIASEDFKDIAELIILMRPNNFSEQAVVIDQLTDYITKSFRLLVVDTITSLYRTKVAEHPEETFQLNRELNRQIACLAQVAKTQKIAVLLISQVRSVFNEAYISIEPVGTRVLKFWADTIIVMKPTENPRIIKAILEKSPKRARHSSCHLRIEKTGVRGHLIH
ncbi:MAG: ATPase domain-containing protein [Candidatus Bathyarchaeia archaeon]|nr:ATPase domain-containing protein [Candidatus Bathyarchaeia archaeon]